MSKIAVSNTGIEAQYCSLLLLGDRIVVFLQKGTWAKILQSYK